MVFQTTVQSYDNMMQECGKIAESLYEGLAGVKGQLNARASRARTSEAHSGACGIRVLCFASRP